MYNSFILVGFFFGGANLLAEVQALVGVEQEVESLAILCC